MTSTEVEQYQARGEVESYQDVAVRRLTEWAASASAAHSMAKTLVQTTFCPPAFRDKPGEATAAILAGLEVGLQPMAALRAFDVISGQAAPRAMTLRAVAQSFGHEIVLVESTSTRCRMKGRRKGSAEWQSVTWTMDRARELGLTGKDNWKKQPTAMLLARATSELARLIAADAILGLGYSAEEVADTGTGVAPASGEDVAEADASSGRRRMSRKTEPEPESEVIEDESPLLDPKGPKMKALHATLNEAGLGDRDAGLAFIAQTLGREVASSKDLTDADADLVLSELRNLTVGKTDPWAVDAAKVAARDEEVTG